MRMTADLTPILFPRESQARLLLPSTNHFRAVENRLRDVELYSLPTPSLPLHLTKLGSIDRSTYSVAQCFCVANQPMIFDHCIGNTTSPPWHPRHTRLQHIQYMTPPAAPPTEGTTAPLKLDSTAEINFAHNFLNEYRLQSFYPCEDSNRRPAERFAVLD